MPCRRRAGNGRGLLGRPVFMLVVKKALIAKVTSKSKPAGVAERATPTSGRRAFPGRGSKHRSLRQKCVLHK